MDLIHMQSLTLGTSYQKQLPGHCCNGKLKEAMEISVMQLLTVTDTLVKLPWGCMKVGAFHVCHGDRRKVRQTEVGANVQSRSWSWVVGCEALTISSTAAGGWSSLEPRPRQINGLVWC